MKFFSQDVFSAVIASSLSGYLLAIFMAYLGIQLDSLNSTALIIGLIFFSRNFFQIFLRVPLAELSQMIGRKPLITAGIGFYSIAFSLMFFSFHWIIVFLATLNVALGMACYWPAMFAYIGDISTDDYGQINGIIFQGSDVGVILGTFLARYLLSNQIVDLNGLFAISAIIGLTGTILVNLTLKESLREEDRKDVSSKFKALKESFVESLNSLLKMTKKSPLGLIYLYQFIISFVEYFFNSFFPLLVVLSLGYSDSDVATIILFGTLILFVFKPYLGLISDKFGFKYPVLISLLINGIVLLLMTYTQSFIILIILYVILLAGSITSYLAVNGATSYSASSQNRGVAMGVLGFYVSFGRSSSSLVLSPIWEILEFYTQNRGESLLNLFRITSIIVVLVVILLLFLSKGSIARENDNSL